VATNLHHISQRAPLDLRPGLSSWWRPPLKRHVRSVRWIGTYAAGPQLAGSFIMI